jgi:hypothetical protein
MFGTELKATVYSRRGDGVLQVSGFKFSDARAYSVFKSKIRGRRGKRIAASSGIPGQVGFSPRFDRPIIGRRDVPARTSFRRLPKSAQDYARTSGAADRFPDWTDVNDLSASWLSSTIAERKHDFSNYSWPVSGVSYVQLVGRSGEPSQLAESRELGARRDGCSTPCSLITAFCAARLAAPTFCANGSHRAPQFAQTFAPDGFAARRKCFRQSGWGDF